MNAYRTALFTAMLAAGIATAAHAQGTMSMAAPKSDDKSDKKDAPKDSMAMGGMMMSKPMKHDAMKGSMKHDAMKPDTKAAPSR